jgi:hypothetical protein
MPGVLQLNHIRKLLDDDSEVVREAVQRELTGMRRELPDYLDMLDNPLTAEEEHLVAELLEPARRIEMEEIWMRWRWLDGECAQLEEGLSQLSAFLNGWKTQPADLCHQLDQLARKAFDECGRMSAHELAEWLFSPAANHGSARFRGNSKDCLLFPPTASARLRALFPAHPCLLSFSPPIHRPKPVAGG